jgi:ABC-type molybdate transport system substrate-binding protein
MNWELRTLRRFAVVFISGGIVAISEELRLFSTGASPEQTIYVAAAMAMLAALDKIVRDHKDAQEASLNTKVSG